MKRLMNIDLQMLKGLISMFLQLKLLKMLQITLNLWGNFLILKLLEKFLEEMTLNSYLTGYMELLGLMQRHYSNINSKVILHYKIATINKILIIIIQTLISNAQKILLRKWELIPKLHLNMILELHVMVMLIEIWFWVKISLSHLLILLLY